MTQTIGHMLQQFSFIRLNLTIDERRQERAGKEF